MKRAGGYIRKSDHPKQKGGLAMLLLESSVMCSGIPQTLQQAMETEIRHSVVAVADRRSNGNSSIMPS